MRSRYKRLGLGISDGTDSMNVALVNVSVSFTQEAEIAVGPPLTGWVNKKKESFINDSFVLK